MLANIPSGILLFLLISVIMTATIVIVGGTIWGLIKARKNDTSDKKMVILLCVLSIVIAAVSWMANFGWIRFIMTFLLIPFIHAIIFFLTNLFVSSYVDKSRKLKMLNLFFIVTYLMFYIFLPDGGDIGGLYFFFGLIHNDTLLSIAEFILSIALPGHVVLFILQIIQVIALKKNKYNGNGN